MPEVPRKLPELEPLTAFFWTSGADGVLRIQRCGACGRWQHPPQPRCHVCHSEDVAPAPVSGRGTVKTFTINRQAWTPALQEPFVFAAIELAEQPELYVLSNVSGPVEAVHSGMPVQVFFERREDVWLPLFSAEASDA
ncbi:MAG: OB-fold domain-containing protein [Novosphingobium sp.]|nr:OB-fold domain-containing protein [Novosphingobium sp.]